jgi:hypothetical protein
VLKTEIPEEKARTPSMAKVPFHLSKRWTWVLGSIGAVILIIAVLSYLISSETVRRYTEQRMNRHLQEYTVQVGRAYFHPLAFSLVLEDLTLIQNANPDPPLASIKGLHARVHWRELLKAHLVGEFEIDRPKLYINLKNIRKEEESKVPLKKKGWQDALQSIYPLKINVFRIRGGDVTYVDEGPYKPLRASQINLRASNIRNIRSPEHVYPSSFHLEGRIFDKGRITLDGRANFLQKPRVGFKADLDLEDMDLSYFEPITNRGNVSVRKGTVSAKGDLEYAPRITEVNLKNLHIKGVDIDYFHLPQTAEAEKKRMGRAAEKAKELSDKPTSKIRIGVLKIENSSFGYVNRTTKPNYRVYLNQTEVTLKDFSNQFVEGPATLEMRGKFMGYGDTRVTGAFRPETKTPDFNLNVAIENTQMPAMSDLFRAYGNFDVKAGLFSFYSELTIKGGMINGYLKPQFKDMKVYDRREESEKNLFHKLYVGLVGGISKLLENPRTGVATKAEISGPVASPETSSWQIILNLIQNAFFKSILPGFEKEVSPPEK